MLIKNRMHPRNIYKNPPNFKELAINFPEFRKYVKQELTGKVTIDYQDQNAVKELTRTLLKKDFDLNVEINETRLIPRVPLCLNYILWIDDLLSLIRVESQPFGIDIGTGCVCIYSLLAAKKGWKMLATELDPENFKSAQINVSKNNLEGVITVKLVSDSSQLLMGVIDKEMQYDFCMCNPPFFSNNEKPQNRTLRRPQLESVASDVPTEISTEGGEISFVTKLIEESLLLKDQIKIFTTLVGKKSDFLQLKKKIQKHNPKSVTFTEFCQGRTTRWGLAWTFLDINLKENTKPESDKIKKSKLKPPLQFTLPEKSAESLGEVLEELRKVLNSLKVSFTEEPFHSGCMFCCKAYENTWSHQRRKKRLKARTDEDASGNQETNEISVEDEDDGECPKAKRLRLDGELNKKDKPLIVEGLMCIKTEDSSVIFEMSWISGNKESFHQIFQYFKNYWSKPNV